MPVAAGRNRAWVAGCCRIDIQAWLHADSICKGMKRARMCL